MFKKYNLNLDLVSEPFENLRYRDRTVLVLCKDRKGKYILGTKKDFYPEGITRLLGGGVDKNEEVASAAIREIKEEVGISTNIKELIELVEVDVSGVLEDKTYRTLIYVYYLNSKNDDYLASDDVSEIVKLSESEYRNLIKRFKELKSDYFYDDGDLRFSWGDFGKVYGFVHQKVLEELLNKDL